MKKKIFFILGIVLCVVGVGVFSFPFIAQFYTSQQQKKLMKDFKQQVLESMNAQNDLAQTAPDSATIKPGVQTPNTDNDSTASNADAPAVEVADSNTVAGNAADTGSVSGSEDAGTQPPEDGEGALPDDSAEGILAGNLTDNVEEPPAEEGNTLSQSRLIGQKCLGIITIDKIDLIYALVEGVDDYNIGVAIGHFPDSVGIGEEGNCALAGHNGGTYGRYFGDIKKLKIGDEVVLTDLRGYEYTYLVTESFVCEPTDVEVVDDLGIPGKYLTMVTCTQHGSKRLIVRAKCTSEPTAMKGFR